MKALIFYKIAPTQYAAFLASILALSSPVWAESFQVTRFDDPIPDGCQQNDCSLREAVMAANNQSGEDSILLDKGIYNLGIPGAGEDQAASGDFDIRETVVITGQGSSETTINGQAIDRIFHVFPGASLSVSDVTLENGDAGTGDGGAIYTRGGTQLKLTRANLSSNKADNGGALRVDGKLTMLSSTVSDNKADFGGAIISTLSGKLDIKDSSFLRNAGQYGGALFTNGTTTISGSTFAYNSATSGGGIFSKSGKMDLRNSTISSNSAEKRGGGLLTDRGKLSLVNVTVANNNAHTGGGLQAANAGKITMGNSIVATNQAADTGGNCAGDNYESAGFNFVEHAACLGGQQVGDVVSNNPVIDKLDQYGGPTLTHALLVQSPAIDSGNSNLCTNTDIGNVDQRGLLRVQAGENLCDKGAFEWRPVANSASPLGTNLGEIARYSTQMPLIDQFKEASNWIPLCGPRNAGCNQNPAIIADLQNRLDENGWLTSLPQPGAGYFGAQVQLLNDPSVHRARAGEYLVLYEGEGAISYGGAASRNNALSVTGRDVIEVSPPTAGQPNAATIRITAIDSDNPIRDIRVIRPQYEQTYASEIFNPVFIEKLESYTALRFMDWLSINHNPPGLWVERATLDRATYI